jgi:uncharacterized protein
MIIKVKVIPNSPKTKISDKSASQDVNIVVELKAKPENNQANIELIKFLAKFYKTDRENIKIKSGFKTRLKLVEIKQTI